MEKLAYPIQTFFEALIGGHNQTAQTKNSLHSNVLFVFVGINWFNIKLLFSSLNIYVSGGSNSHRHILSTTEFMLSRYLLDMKYDIFDISNSKDIERKFNQARDNVILETNEELSSSLSFSKILHEYNKYLEVLPLEIEKLKFYIRNFEVVLGLEKFNLDHISNMLEAEFYNECKGAKWGKQDYLVNLVKFKKN